MLFIDPVLWQSMSEDSGTRDGDAAHTLHASMVLWITLRTSAMLCLSQTNAHHVLTPATRSTPETKWMCCAVVAIIYVVKAKKCTAAPHKVLTPQTSMCCAGGQEAVHSQHQGRDDPADLHHAQGSSRQPAPVYDDATGRGQAATAGSGEGRGMCGRFTFQSLPISKELIL